MPIDYSKYPSNWKTEIRPRILKRAGEIRIDGEVKQQAFCEFCGIMNKSLIFRGEGMDFEYCEDWLKVKESKRGGFWRIGDGRVKIVLTIAHLDHDEENHNVKDDRLAALCQRCHLKYDAKEKARRRKVKKYSKSLFPLNK